MNHNKLYGKALYMQVYQLTATLPAPVTNNSIAEHLVATCDPKMTYSQRELLRKRVERTTRQLRRDGLLAVEQRESLRKVVYHELKRLA